MSRTATRDALIGLINNAFVTAYPGIPIVYDNESFNRNSPPPVWVEYEIRFLGGDQVGISFVPKTRNYGFLYVTIWVKEGTGSKRASTMCDWFAEQLKYVASGGVNLQAAEPVSCDPPKGWYMEQVKLYFYTDPT